MIKSELIMSGRSSEKLPYSLFEFPNGLQVVFWPLSGVEVVCFGVRVRAGGWCETNLKRGIFHFLEHALVQGTKNFPSFRKLSQRQEDLGLRTDNGVSGDFSFYQWSIPKENFSKGLELLAEYIFDPLFPQDGIEREREIILQEYQDYWDSPYHRFVKALSESFWGKDHPYTLDALGTREGITTINRDDIIKVHRKWYKPRNMVLVVVGDLKEKEVEEVVGKFFGAKPSTSFLAPLSFSKPKFQKNYLLWSENFKQVSFCLAFPTFGYKERVKKEQLALSMLSYILIDSRWSRLSIRLREKEPLAYSLWGASSLYPQGGFLDINASFSPENTEKILKVVYEEVENIKMKGIENDEFERARKYFCYESLMGFDTVYSIAINLISYLFREGKVFLPQDRIREINKLKKSDVERMAREILVYEKSTAAIMAKKDLLEELQLIRLPW